MFYRRGKQVARATLVQSRVHLCGSKQRPKGGVDYITIVVLFMMFYA